MVVEEKVGRSKCYVLAFRSVLHRDGSMHCGHLGDKTKLYADMGRDQEELATGARRGAPEGAIAWRSANPRVGQAFLDELPEGADVVWRELVERGEELEMCNHLVAQAKGGPIPKSSEFVRESAHTQFTQFAEADKLRRPAQESLEAAVVSKETLAAMRRRIVADSYR
ncbi:hypothetical protein [Streptomyces rubiginosohelvolus]|uniref:hypothetical protein n=1 Tax=Streptomyces rubiginosohelvolus TaxID=67362 RepID=UPI003799E532